MHANKHKEQHEDGVLDPIALIRVTKCNTILAHKNKM